MAAYEAAIVKGSKAVVGSLDVVHWVPLEGFEPERVLGRAVWWMGHDWQGQRLEAGRLPQVRRLPQGSPKRVKAL